MDIINDFVSKDIIVKLKPPNQRAYEVAWPIALLRGYESFDEFVNDVFLDSIEMFPDGRDDFENIRWGFQNKRTEGERTSKDISIREQEIVEMQNEINMDLRVRITESQYEALKQWLKHQEIHLTNIFPVV
jgi:hypothetical protein